MDYIVKDDSINQNLSKIEIYRIDKALDLPKYETAQSFGFDFIVREDTIIEKNTLALIPGNVIVKCPKNLALIILPRSSTFRKKSLIFPHSIGLIDGDYCGENDEIMIQVFNLGEKLTIKRGEKIAQGLFIQVATPDFKEITIHDLKKDSRGGFGSTDY